jgi:hypothetical protein
VGDEPAHDLACLVDRAVDVAPSAGDLHVGLVDLPAVPDGTPAGTSHLAEQRREPSHPAVDGEVVDRDPAFDQQFLYIAVRQREAQVSTHC